MEKNELYFDENSVKIFKYVYNTEKNIRLYGIAGSDDAKIDEVVASLAPFTQLDPMHNPALPHNTCDNYFGSFHFPTCYTFEDGKKIMNPTRLVLLYPETGMNIREQQKFVDTLITKILSDDEVKDMDNFEIVIVTNSLWILSDIPSKNVNVYNIERCDSSEYRFFAGNLIDILANFSPDIMTGQTSAHFAQKLIDIKNNNGTLDDELVSFVSDDFIKNYLRSSISWK